MRFSVIVPIYQAARYLEACIGSVLAQKCRDWELILVDDGSTDGGAALADRASAADARIQVVHQQNCGQFFARQNGIRRAKGEYLLFLDADDRLASDCMEKLEQVIEAHRPDMILFCCQVTEEDGLASRRLGWLGERPKAISPDALRDSLLSADDLNSLCFKAIKRELFEKDDTDYSALRGTHFGEDKIQLLFPVTHAAVIRYLPDSLYLYNYRQSSTMHAFRAEQIPAMLRGELFRALEQAMVRWSCDDPEHRQALAAYEARSFLSVYYGYRKRRTSAQEKEAFRKYPWRKALRQKLRKYVFNHQLSCRDKAKLLFALAGF